MNPPCLILTGEDKDAHWNPDLRDRARLPPPLAWRPSAHRCDPVPYVAPKDSGPCGTPPRLGFPVCWVKSGLHPTRALTFSSLRHTEKTRGLSVLEQPARSPQHQGGGGR